MVKVRLLLAEFVQLLSEESVDIVSTSSLLEVPMDEARTAATTAEELEFC